MQLHPLIRHVHYDIILLWASGAEIEFKAEGYTKWMSLYKHNPAWTPTTKYRVKAETKEDTVQGVQAGGYGKYIRKTPLGEMSDIRLIFDGETGQLKSVEMLNH